MPLSDIRGFAPERFAALRAAFEDNLTDELGVRFTVVERGEVVADLMGGFADRARTRPFGPQTLTPVFSTTKALAATMVARLADAGRLTYDQPVAEVWPQFAQGGKAAITIGQVMSHQAGLCGFPEEMQPAEWFDWDLICSRLAAMAPLWPPGTRCGYHPVTFGYLAGEIFRRVDGRTLGAALREDIAGPAGLDLWIGLPDAEHARVAEMEKPKTVPRFGEINAAVKAAFLTRWASPGGRGSAEWRRVEIPSANGHATAEALARFMGALADGGAVNGVQVLSPPAIAEVSAERIAGLDLVLPFQVGWGAGVLRNPPNLFYGPGPNAFGHSGWGGSCAFADPDRGVAMAYVMNRQSAELLGDPRARLLIEAAYLGL